MDELRDTVGTKTRRLEERVASAIETLAREAAAASNAFALASTAELQPVSERFYDAVDAAVEESTELDLSDVERDRLEATLAVERAYLRGVLDGGVLSVTLRDGFPDGDWDEPGPVGTLLRERFAFVVPRFTHALQTWAAATEVERARPPAPEAQAEQEAPTPRGAPPRGGLPPETPTQLEPSTAAQPPGGDRLKLLLAFAGELGVRIKKVPKNPPSRWLDKLQEKLEEIGRRKGIQSPFSFEGEEKGTEETMAFVLPGDPGSRAALEQRVELLVSKADRAGLNLGSIPENPTEDWLSDIEGKLDKAMEARRVERREKREKLARHRKERIARLERYAAELRVDLGRIPPFPTEDWLTRSELRIAERMLPRTEGPERSDRAGRLAALLARASDAEVELEVPPDPDEVWLGWAESKVDKALGGGDALAVGADPDEVVEKVPTLLFEEDTVQEQRWPIDATPFTIGRARKNNIQIRHDGQLSRQHCAIEAAGDGWTVQDLRSTQGTRLNGQPVRSPTPLQPGDVITIGETRLVFRML